MDSITHMHGQGYKVIDFIRHFVLATQGLLGCCTMEIISEIISAFCWGGGGGGGGPMSDCYLQLCIAGGLELCSQLEES